jgi:hypothetical protein
LKIIPGTEIQQARSPWRTQAPRLTNFYPLYSASNDQVDPVLPVQPALFQLVLPRYRLSTSETRDQGTGPVLEAAPPPGLAVEPYTETRAHSRLVCWTPPGIHKPVPTMLH